MRKQRLLAAILSAGLVCGLLSGCGSSTETTTESATETTTAETVTQAAADGQETADDEWDNETFVSSQLDYAEEEDGNLILTVIAETFGGTFADTLSGEQISFDGDLEQAANIEVASVNEDKDEAEITLSIPKNDLDVENLNLTSRITFASGAILDDNQNALSEEVSAESLYVTEPEDKAAAPGDARVKISDGKYGLLFRVSYFGTTGLTVYWYLWDWQHANYNDLVSKYKTISKEEGASQDIFKTIIVDVRTQMPNDSKFSQATRSTMSDYAAGIANLCGGRFKTVYVLTGVSECKSLKTFVDRLRNNAKDTTVKVLKMKSNGKPKLETELLKTDGVTEDNLLDKLSEWEEDGIATEVTVE
jgi:hypothetical protein